MRRYKLVLAAAMTAMMITACGSGDGIVINGTTAAEAVNTEAPAESEAQKSTEELAAQQGGSTKIEIVTGETTAAASLEGQTEPIEEETTAAETTAAETTAAPTRAPETTAARTYAVRDVEKTMYATSSVRIRASYSTSAEVLGALKQGEKIEVTGESENGWMRVNYKGHTAYVSKSYLTETAPSSTTSSSNTGSAQTGGQTGTGQGTSSGQTSRPTSTTDTGTTPGGTSGGATSPGTTTPGGTSGGATSPGATTPGGTSGGATSPGATTPGGTSGGATSPGATAPGGTSSGATSSGSTSTSVATGTAGSISGSITALDPSGVTIQTSEGKSYSFVWGGNNIPALAPGEKIQIQYVTNGSTNTVTGVSK